MCFHNSMSKKAQQLAARYGRKSDVIEIVKEILEEQNHVNAFANPLCPIITGSDQVQAAHWGLIPSWTKTKEDAEKIRRITYNARSETLFEKPSFRHAIRFTRCIVPSTGYFEYHHNPDGSTTPYYIYDKKAEDGIFSIGGLFEEWLTPGTDEVIKTFSIITTPANEMTREIHNGGKNPGRMPLILHPLEEEEWLSEFNKSLLETYPAETMEAYEVDSNFRKKVIQGELF